MLAWVIYTYDYTYTVKLRIEWDQTASVDVSSHPG